MSIAGTLRATDASTGTHESNVLFNRALEMVSRNRVAVARECLEKALQICPRHPGYLSLYGLCVAIESDDYASALTLCERAVKMRPNDPVPRVNLGKVLRMTGDNRRAYGEFLAAWRLDKSHGAPAAELSRMGIRRPPVVPFLPRSHFLNVRLGKLRARLLRMSSRIGL